MYLRKPAGYANPFGGSTVYIPYNGYVSGSRSYVPGAPTSEVITITFLDAPDDLSVMAVPDGPGDDPGTPTTNFTFTYGGAPGAGIIPLEAGGGSSSQAATAAQVALSAQLNNWTVTNPSAGVLVMSYNEVGFNLSEFLLENITIDLMAGEESAVEVQSVLAAPGGVLPGKFGRNYCFLSA